jgi:hypothetical protein
VHGPRDRPGIILDPNERGAIMDLGKITRDSEDRSVVWGAVVASVLALVNLINAGLAAGAGDGPSAGVYGTMGLVLLALAYGVYRGSRACAIAVFGLWAASLALGLLAYGPGALLSVPNVVFTVMLFAGMRGVFAQHARNAAGLPVK